MRGDLNLLGVLGIDPEVRNGFETIKVHFAVEADACPAAIEAGHAGLAMSRRLTDRSIDHARAR